MRCLVVDTSPTVRRAVTRALQRISAGTVLAADDPATALEQVEPPLDLVVIGWSATDDLGLTLLRELRAHPMFAATPTVIVTPRGAHDEVRAAVAAGANDYLLRPILPEALAERLARWITPPAAEAKPAPEPAARPAPAPAAPAQRAA